MASPSIFKPEHNCWQVDRSTPMSVIIDCENFYRAVYESICKAQKTLFILGWDIDSRIDLLHGEEADQASQPFNIRELIKTKAEQNPDLNIYLVRWDSSLAFFTWREVWLEGVWKTDMPSNVHIVLDDTIPVGGSHHQKLIVVDDEVVFSGGMDIAVQRWDTREHLPNSPEREDCCGAYGPYHDVQSVMAGPIVKHYSELVRWRWDRIADEQAVQFSPADNEFNADHLPQSWPQSVRPLADNMLTAIARTLPDMGDTQPTQEVRTMLLELVQQAEHFIYIENQFVSYQPLAEALNKQLKQKPNLKVFIVSSYKPKGVSEQESYWAGRIKFKQALMQGIEDDRVCMAYSSVEDEQDDPAYKLIHAKLLFVDDRYMVIGSSNISKRSMSADTECDVVFFGETDGQRQAIVQVRNDLLAEHCSRTIEDVAECVTADNAIEQLLKNKQSNRYKLNPVNDEQFTDGSFKSLVDPVLDPDEPIVEGFNKEAGNSKPVTNPPHKWIVFGSLLAVAVVVGALLVWAFQYLPDDLSKESLTQLLKSNSENLWLGLGLVMVIFVVAGFIFIPVTMLTLAVAAVYGPWYGAVASILGAALSAIVMFFIGQLLGDTGLRNLGGPKVQAVNKKLANVGVFGVMLLRMVPIAPYTFVNLVAGISSLSFSVYLIGTLFGIAPAILANSLVGNSLFKMFTDPSSEAATYLIVGIVAWLSLVLLGYYLSRRNSADKNSSSEPSNNQDDTQQNAQASTRA